MVIRVASIKDKLSIAQMHRESFIQAYNKLLPNLDTLCNSEEQYIDRWKNRLMNTETTTLIHAENNELIKGLIHYFKIESNANIQMLYIHPKYQRQGIGRKLVETCINKIAEWEVRVESTLIWVLESNINARSFYESVGCKTDGLTRFNQTFKMTEVQYYRKYTN